MSTPPLPSARSLDLAEIALENSAQSVQHGATLRNRRDLDPLAREYLVAAREVAALRVATYGEAD